MLNTALRFLVAVASAAILANAASAQGWPSKPVTYIVPFAAGSGPDVLARNIRSCRHLGDSQISRSVIHGEPS